jgi:phospholipid-binding lipoprotein MlaA
MAFGFEMKHALFAAAMICAALGGCATQTVSIHSAPPDDPAAQNAAAAENAAAFAAAASTAAATATGDAAGTASSEAGGRAPNAGDVQPLTPADAPSMYTYDPWDRLNRFTYRFNARFDEAIFLPAANLYRRVPSPLRAGVHNFFGNLSEVDSVINYGLQWQFGRSVRSLGRFVINSTLGIGGLIDVAKRLKLPGAPTGFSNTLARWGMHPGPYLVIPLIGPSTLRDGVGFLGDFGTTYAINLANLYRGDVSWGLDVANAVDQRANVNFRYYSSGSPFEYDNIRFLYVRKRLIEDEGLRAKSKSKGTKSTTRQESDANAPAGK